MQGSKKMAENILVIGAGSSGIFTSIELARRGFGVKLIDRGMAGSGTSMRFHGLLHSGARYAVVDSASAIECRKESLRILEAAPHCVEQTGGLFVALDREEEEYGEQLATELRRCSIPYHYNDSEETLKTEHNLNTAARCSLSVQDNVLKGGMFIACSILTAVNLGVDFLPFTELEGAEFEGRCVRAVRTRNVLSGRNEKVEADFVINCAGPWVGETSELLGNKIEILPAAGIMSVVGRRLSMRVLNRMRRPSDGDILVPYGSRTIAGTTAAVSYDVSSFDIDEDDVQLLKEEAATMVPLVSQLGFTRSYASFRPLLKDDSSSDARRVSRDFRIVRDESKVENLVTVVGGKMTTCMLVGENAANAVLEAIGSSAGAREPLKLFNPLDTQTSGTVGDALHSGKEAALIDRLRGGTDEEEMIPAALFLSMLRGRGGNRNDST